MSGCREPSNRRQEYGGDECQEGQDDGRDAGVSSPSPRIQGVALDLWRQHPTSSPFSTTVEARCACGVIHRLPVVTEESQRKVSETLGRVREQLRLAEHDAQNLNEYALQLERRLRDSETDASNLQQQLTETENTLKRKSEENALLHAKTDRQAAEVLQLKYNLEESQRAAIELHTSLQQKINALERSNQSYASAMSDLEAELVEARNSIQQQKAHIAEQQQKATKLAAAHTARDAARHTAAVASHNNTAWEMFAQQLGKENDALQALLLQKDHLIAQLRIPHSVAAAARDKPDPAPPVNRSVHRSTSPPTAFHCTPAASDAAPLLYDVLFQLHHLLALSAAMPAEMRAAINKVLAVADASLDAPFPSLAVIGERHVRVTTRSPTAVVFEAHDGRGPGGSWLPLPATRSSPLAGRSPSSQQQMHSGETGSLPRPGSISPRATGSILSTHNGLHENGLPTSVGSGASERAISSDKHQDNSIGLQTASAPVSARKVNVVDPSRLRLPLSQLQRHTTPTAEAKSSRTNTSTTSRLALEEQIRLLRAERRVFERENQNLTLQLYSGGLAVKKKPLAGSGQDSHRK